MENKDENDNVSSTYEKKQSFHDFVIDEEKLNLVMTTLKGVMISETPENPKYSYGLKAAKEALENFNSPQPNSEIFSLHPNEIEDLSRLPPEHYIRFLDYRYRYEMFPQLKILEEYPPCVQIEPTSICNYRCVFCYQTDKNLSDKKNGHMGVMSLELFKDIIDQLEGNVEAISLASRGEPTVCKHLGEMLLYMKGKFLGSKINTNASLLNEKLIHDILSAEPGTVVFSADAAEDPLYGQLRVNGSLEKVLKNINLFNEIREKHYSGANVITRVSGVKVQEQQNIESMEELWGQIVDQVAFVNYCPWVNCYEGEDSNVSTPCTDLWRRMFIWWDGKCNPCDVDYLSKLKVGDYDGSITKIWRGPVYERYRRLHMQEDRKKLFPCNKCYVV